MRQAQTASNRAGARGQRSSGFVALAGVRGVARALLSAARPRQWTKNLIVFAPLVFAGGGFAPVPFARSAAAFGLFCLASSAVYLLNDVRDAHRDRAHPVKRQRPVASGALDATTAVAAGFTVGIAALAGAWLLGAPFALAVAFYLALQAAYALWLKNQVVLDVMTISAGFVLRAVAGALVIGVPSSPWLVACAALLMLFLGFGKRRHELLVGDNPQEHRPVLAEYSELLLDSILSTVASATIAAYALYSFFSATGERHPYLMITVPFVVYGIFRYQYLMYRKDLSGSPEEVLLTDVPLIADIALWLVVSWLIVNVLA